MEPSAKPAGPTEPFLVRHDFLLRRLHSLSGLIPVGAYMVVHLVTNASVLNGAETFQNSVDTIHSLGVVLPLVEWTFIFIPLLFHALFGFLIIKSGQSNTGQYPLKRNVRYLLQRWTGVIAFCFIMYHIWQLHWMGGAIGGGHFDPHAATSTAGATIRSAPWIPAIYAIGVLACVYHLANGLWTMGITWGVWTSPNAQRRADYVCMAFGVGLAIVGLSALFGMTTVDLAEAQAVEQARDQKHTEQRQRIEQRRLELEKSVRRETETPVAEAASSPQPKE